LSIAVIAESKFRKKIAMIFTKILHYFSK